MELRTKVGLEITHEGRKEKKGTELPALFWDIPYIRAHVSHNNKIKQK
jgi:hypothetical protein